MYNVFMLSQEKLRPIDKKLAYQIEKLLAAGQRPADEAAAAAGAEGAGDALSYGPRPDQLLPRLQPGNAGDASADGALCIRIRLGICNTSSRRTLDPKNHTCHIQAEPVPEGTGRTTQEHFCSVVWYTFAHFCRRDSSVVLSSSNPWQRKILAQWLLVSMH